MAQVARAWSEYPDLMEALLDVAENRETIAAEIAENSKWLFSEVERRAMLAERST